MYAFVDSAVYLYNQCTMGYAITSLTYKILCFKHDVILGRINPERLTFDIFI